MDHLDAQLYARSLMKALFDQGKDIIDAYWPLILIVMPRDQDFVSLRNIQKAVDNKYNVHIIEHTLQEILDRAHDKGLIFFDGTKFESSRKYALTDTGISSVQALESDRDLHRRINELLDDANQFLIDHYGMTME
jgi:hypothetical protein